MEKVVPWKKQTSDIWHQTKQASAKAEQLSLKSLGSNHKETLEIINNRRNSSFPLPLMPEAVQSALELDL